MIRSRVLLSHVLVKSYQASLKMNITDKMPDVRQDETATIRPEQSCLDNLRHDCDVKLHGHCMTGAVTMSHSASTSVTVLQ